MITVTAINEKRLIISLLFFFVLSLPSPIYAHKLLIEPIETGIIKVMYDDGSFSTRTSVTVFDDKGVEIEVGSLDSNGYFYYDDKQAFSFVAEDGMGHRSEWRIDKEMVSESNRHRLLIALAVVFISVLIAVYFSIKTKIKKNQLSS